MTYLGNITDLKQLHYMFDGKRKFNSGFVGRDKVREIAIAVFRDDPIGIYNLKPSLFNTLKDQYGQEIKTASQFQDFINNPTFDITHPLLNFINIY